MQGVEGKIADVMNRGSCSKMMIAKQITTAKECRQTCGGAAEFDSKRYRMGASPWGL